MTAKSTTAKHTLLENASSGFIGGLLLKTVATVFSVLVFLSLLSHHPEDTHFINGGLGHYTSISNWIGLFGAHVSSQLIAWLGLAAHMGIVLILVCVFSRLVRKHLLPANRIYFAGIVVFIWGCSMLLGVYPSSFHTLTQHLNISQTTGGVIGQRFCAPMIIGESSGWLTWVVNPVGSIIISLSMIVVGLVTVWHFDWQDSTLTWWNSLKARMKGKWKGSAVKVREKQSATIIPNRACTDTEKTRLPEPKFDTGGSAFHESDKQDHLDTRLDAQQETEKKRRPSRVISSTDDYMLPPLSLLNKAQSTNSVTPAEIEAKKEILQDTLDSFSIDAFVGEITSGPRVTLFEIRTAAGVKVERISSLSNNIAMNLKAESLRILTPIPGKDTVGIEVPNSSSSAVALRDLFESKMWIESRDSIPLALGKNISGEPAILDLAKAPHLLIAGATGSGKSVCMNTIILSLLYRFSPNELKLIMVDPKVVEFSGYNSLPHLVTPVITQVKKVPAVLRWVLNQMEWRYAVHSKAGVRNIAAFNSKTRSEDIFDDEGALVPAKLPYIIVIIDELADIMMTAKAEVETSLARIAQLARAVGIHVIVATQRPSVNVITGIIKANFPTRIAFQVTSIVDSRTILDGKGAESLLGRGDALFKPPGGARLERTQGAIVEDEDIEKVVDFVADQAQADYIDDILSFGTKEKPKVNDPAPSGADTALQVPTTDASVATEAVDGDEELVQNAIKIILRDRRATTSHIQRRLRIGYNRAALIIEQLEQRGIVGPQVGSAPRQILMEDDSNENGDVIDE